MNGSGAAAIRGVLDRWLATQTEAALAGETVGRGADLLGLSAGLLDRFGPDRVVDLPALDASQAGWALGRAMAGQPTVLELVGPEALSTVAPFLATAVRCGVALPLTVLVPMRTGGSLAAVLGTGADLFVASEPGQAAALVDRALASGRVSVVALPVAVLDAVPATARPTDAHLVVAGDQAVLLAWGSAVGLARSAAEALAGQGIPTSVVDLPVLGPRPDLAPWVTPSGRVVVVHHGDPALADAVRLAAIDAGFEFLECPPAIADSVDASIAAVRAATTW